MRNFLTKQSGSEVILEEVIEKWINYENSEGIVGTQLNPNWPYNNQLILTSIDPNIKVGDLIREDQLEISWQYQLFHLTDARWFSVLGNNEKEVSTQLEYYREAEYPVRQVAKLKQVDRVETPIQEETQYERTLRLLDKVTPEQIQQALDAIKNRPTIEDESGIHFSPFEDEVQEHKPESEDNVIDGIFSHVIKQGKNNPFVQASKIVDDYVNDCCMDVPRRIGMDIMAKLYESGFEITKKK